MMTSLRARTKTACRIANVDPDRFNEAVHAGNYPCAPQTSPGSARVFDVDDMIALHVYSRLLSQEIPPRRAGHIACSIRAILQEYPDTDRVVEVTLSSGLRHYLREQDFKREATSFNRGGFIMEVREFRLEFIRDRVISDLQEEAGIIGEE